MSIYDSLTGKSDLAADDLSMIKRGMTAQELFNTGSSGFTPTEAQLSAMNSGITSDKVLQIETNKEDISTLNTTISPTDFQLPSIDSTISEICTIGSGGYVSIGNCVILNLRFTTTDAIITNVRMFQLPAPLADSGLADGAGVVTCMLTNITGTDSRIIFITKAGYIFNPSNGTSIPAGSYLISACYIKSES